MILNTTSVSPALPSPVSCREHWKTLTLQEAIYLRKSEEQRGADMRVQQRCTGGTLFPLFPLSVSFVLSGRDLKALLLVWVHFLKYSKIFVNNKLFENIYPCCGVPFMCSASKAYFWLLKKA